MAKKNRVNKKKGQSAYKCLLVNASYEAMRLISEHKLIKLLWAGKVEVISHWEEKISWGNGTAINLPATVRFKERKPQFNTIVSFNRISLYQRDKYTCQYCWAPYHKSRLTIDHIIPTSRGGRTNWENCVAACSKCNAQKADLTPEEAGMELLRKPARPTQAQLSFYYEYWHPDWNNFLGVT